MDKKDVVMKDGSVSGNVVVGMYILDRMGVDKEKIQQAEWGVLWGCLFAYRSNAKAALKVNDLDKIADDEFKIPAGSSERAKAAYAALSNVLNNLLANYPKGE